MSKLLSIIIPSYNMEKYLDKCVGSLIVDDKDLLQKLDIIVVNDGSKDRTSEIGHAWETKYPDVVRVIDKQNGNYGSCVNRGLHELRGAFVKVLDADDSLDQSGLLALMRVLDSCEDSVDLVVSEYVQVDPDGKILVSSTYSLPQDHAFTLDVCLGCKNQLYLHAITYRSSLFTRFDYRQTEGISYTDSEWITEPMAFVRKVRYVPDVVYHYLVGRDGQTMKPETYNKNFHMVSRIALGLGEKWRVLSRSTEKASVAYVHKQIYEMIALVYKMNLYNRDPVVGYPNDNLAQFDARLRKASPSLYDEIGQYVIPSNHFPFHPVRAYRRWHIRCNPEILAHKLYSKIMCAVGRLHRNRGN